MTPRIVPSLTQNGQPKRNLPKIHEYVADRYQTSSW